MLSAAAGDHWGNALRPDLLAVLVMVIAPVGVDPVWPLAGPSAAAADRRDGLDQGHELGDVVALPGGQTTSEAPRRSDGRGAEHYAAAERLWRKWPR